MPRLKNKKTGEEYDITPEELAQIKANPNLLRAFEVTEAEIPEEVKALQQENRLTIQKRPAKKNNTAK